MRRSPGTAVLSVRCNRVTRPGAVGTVGQPERVTQNRVVALFHDELGYRYLGDWTDRDGNSNIEESLLSAWLTKRGCTPVQIGVALHKLRTEADNHSRTLYGNNQAVYNLLRYGVPVKIEAGKVTETVHLIDWHEPEQNDFAIAEEVTLAGNHERRPDLVLCVNGIAIGVLELKNSRVTIGDGIRHCLSNQAPMFHAWFFSTVQFIFAGNDSEGLQYGSVGTPEKYFLKWKQDEADNRRFKLLLRQHGDSGRPPGTGAAAGRALQGDRGPGARLRQHRRRTGSRGTWRCRHQPHQEAARPLSERPRDHPQIVVHEMVHLLEPTTTRASSSR